MLRQADIRRKARVALILRATGPWSRRPHPGQQWVHGWIPVGPTAAAARKWHRTLDGLRKLITAVQSGDQAFTQVSGGLHGQTEIITHENGTQTVHKVIMDATSTMGPGFEPKRQGDAEQLASLLAQRIGAPAPAVLRYDEDEIFADLVPGERADRAAKAQGRTVEELAARHMGTTAAARLATFDILAGNWDRGNETNWNVDSNGIVWGFDHALSFWDGAGQPDDPPEFAAGPFAAFWFLHQVRPQQGWRSPVFEWKDNPLTPADVQFLREKLAEVEDDFTALGRHDWWEFASARLDAIAAHATGSQGVFT